MKFLKTFLFTISLTFLSFGFVSLSGYCEAVPSLSPDLSSFQVIEGGGMPYYYGMQGYGEMYFMTPEFNVQFMNDLSDVLNSEVDYSVANGYGLPNGAWGNGDLAIANSLANLFSKGAMNYSQMIANNYVLISHKAKQWGNNAKEYFIGKVDQATGVISDAVGNLVTKVTQEGINNYLGYTSTLINNDSLSVLGDHYLYVNSYKGYSTANTSYSDIIEYSFSTSSPFILFTLNNGEMRNGSYRLYIAIPSDMVSNSSQYYDSFNCSGTYVFFGGDSASSTHASMALYFPQTVVINGVNYRVGTLAYNSVGVFSKYPLGNYNSISDLVTVLNGVLFTPNYVVNGNSNDLQALLNRLVGKYVDSNIMGQISDKIAKSPIIIQYDTNNNPIPVAQPDNALLDEIGDLIDTAIANSAIYEPLLDPLEDPEPVPDPEPSPDNQGTEVPEDFPTTIFTPINDSVGSMFDFVSIFEPLFYIFSFSTGLLGLWLVVPFVILFLILFRLLK